MEMSKMKIGGKDLIVEDILNGINRDALHTLSFEQLAEIKKVVVDNLPNRKKHSIDVHFTIPLFFKRFYFVISSGPDIRRNKKDSEEITNLRAKTKPSDVAIIIVCFLSISAFMGTIIFKIFQAMAAR